MSEHKQMLADAVTRLFRDAGDAAAAAEEHTYMPCEWSVATPGYQCNPSCAPY